FLRTPSVPTSPRFPYTTLFRSVLPLQHFFPEVRRSRARGVGRVACGSGVVMAAVERQEVGLLPCQLRCHVYLVVIDGEVHQRARDRKSTRLNSSHVSISYAVFC